MNRVIIIIIGVVTYTFGLGVLLYMVGWLYPWDFMPTTIDNPLIEITKDRFGAFLIDSLLVLLFGLQHSVMVRESFKRVISKCIKEPFTRAFYTIISSLFLGLIIIFWQPINIVVWQFEGFGVYITLGLYILGWSIAVISTFLIDHFELFGVHQIYRYITNTPEPKSEFTERGFYRYVRHPIQSSTLVGMWATPYMSMGHLLFSLLFTLYVAIGLYFEERDLTKSLTEYLEYKKRVPMLFPKLW